MIVAATALGVAGYELYKHWDGVKAFFQDLWDGISAAFEHAWQRIKPIVDKIKDGFNWVDRYLPGGSAPSPAQAEHYRRLREGKLAGAAGPAAAPYAATPAESAFLKSLAGGEAKSYSELYGGGSLKGLPTDQYGFPLWAGKMGLSGISHAAGFYQFEPGTWDTEAKKLGLKDFSAKSQDIAAWDLAATTYAARTHRDLAADLAAGRVKDIAAALHDQWTSATPALTSRLGRNLASLSKPIGRTAAAHSTIEHKHAARVSLDFRNLPPGLKPNIATEGAPYDDFGFGFAFDGAF